MIFETMDALEAHVRARGGKKCMAAVVEAAEDHVLEAVIEAAQRGLIDTRLYGRVDEIVARLQALGANPDEFTFVACQTAEESAVQAGIASGKNEVDIIVKGLIPTGTLLKNLFKEETGFRVSGKLISHINIVQIAHYHKLLALCDSAINTHPTLEQKREIMANAIATLQNMGIEKPKVALIAATESVSEKMPETVHAATLKAEYANDPTCIVDGPLSYDLATNKEAADIKGYSSPVAGDADLLVCPDIVSANILIKCLRYAAKALTTGLVVGGKVPIVLNSRAASSADKYRTMVLAASASS